MKPHQDDQAGPLFITEEIEAEMIEKPGAA